jgi:hypothetical protein
LDFAAKDFMAKLGLLFEEGCMNILQNLLNSDHQEMEEKDIFYQ